MTTRILLVGALIFGGLAASVSPAHADDFSGTYAFRSGVGETAGAFSAVWTVTPCGDDCRHIVTSTGATDAQAHLEGGTWAFDKFVDPGIECPGNSYNFTKRKLAVTMHFRINPDTLLGQYQPLGTPCGGTAPPVAFSLARTLN